MSETSTGAAFKPFKTYQNKNFKSTDVKLLKKSNKFF